MLDSGKGALEFISESDMGGLDENALNDLCKQAVESNPKAVEDYKNGKEKAIKSLVGNVMKNSRGKADPALAESKLRNLSADNLNLHGGVSYERKNQSNGSCNVSRSYIFGNFGCIQAG